MIELARAQDIERFRAAITKRLGLQFEDDKLGFLADVLQRRLDRIQISSDTYLLILEQGINPDEIGALARELTVTETYFFRNIEQFHALAETVFPARMRVQRKSSTLRILSAGCASGEEAYSIAVVANKMIAGSGWSADIRAVDLNPAGLEKAARGRYPSWAMRETPADIQRRWFRVEGREMILDETLREAVTFETKNLVLDDPALWLPDHYDVIFFRNVMMYFSPAHMKAVIARMARSLAPGGFLFLGHAETLRGLSDDFQLHHTHRTFYYQRKDDAQAPPREDSMHTISFRPRTAAVAYGDTWADQIREASERVAVLIPEHETSPFQHVPNSWDLSLPLELLSRERFAEALASLRRLPLHAQKNSTVLLLEATLLAQSSQFQAAQEVCLRLLTLDDLNAGAHYLLALCRETSGDRNGAAEHDRVAIYLDPAFAMPRLHLGFLARRAGDSDLARREFGQALVLLKREDPSRLMFFGGGFAREGLIGLCEAALKDCGGRP